MTFEEYKNEYDRLFKWRELWQRLSNRKPKTWRGKLQSRDEAVQRRAKIADGKIRNLIIKWDTEKKNMNKVEVEVDYVAGFLFDENLLSVALIEKIKPDWQKGKLNAIGGKIEPGETPSDAMRREFLEETGLDISHWEKFCVLRGENNSKWRVHFFYAIGNPFKIKKMEDEKPMVIPVTDVGSWYWQTIPNLSWLVPMAYNFAAKKENCSEFQVVEV